MSWQPPPAAKQASTPPAENTKPDQNIDYYELLQVNRDSHPTIIRYAYRFLAAMYHPIMVKQVTLINLELLVRLGEHYQMRVSARLTI